MSLSQNPSFNQLAAVVGGTAAASLALLAIKYPNRAAFSVLNENVPAADGHPIIGHLWKQIQTKDTLHDNTIHMFEKLDSLTFQATALGLPPMINTIDPVNVEYFLKTNFANYVKGPQMMHAMGFLFGHGIFVANGEQWKYQRKAASYIFNVKNFRDHFTEVFVQEIHTMCSRIFDKKVANGKPVDFHDIMFKFTLDSFVELGFGVKLHALETRGKVPFAESFDKCQVNCFDRFINPLVPVIEFLKPIFKPGTMTIKQHVKVVDDFAYSIIKERRQQIEKGGEFKDLMSRFMTTKNENGELLNDQELRDTVLNFIIAGRDTTAQALSWGFYCLMLHPRVEAKLCEEIQNSVRDEDENDPQTLYEVIKDMTYAHAVFYEILRLYPSVPANVKTALEDDVWPDGTHVRKGDSVGWSSYAQGRSTKLWGPDAKEFKPERWLTPEGDLRRETQGLYSVFHVGPRVCLGQNLATLEALVAIVMLLRRYKFTLAPNQDITFQISLTHPMKSGMKVFVDKRH